MDPNADREDSLADNQATFLMSNMVAQSPNNNQGPWGDLENYLRSLVHGNAMMMARATARGPAEPPPSDKARAAGQAAASAALVPAKPAFTETPESNGGSIYHEPGRKPSWFQRVFS